MHVYVAIVPLRYEIMAVAESPDEAIELASAKALQFLRESNAVTMDTNTASKVAEYFGVNVTQIKLGTAVVMG